MQSSAQRDVSKRRCCVCHLRPGSRSFSAADGRLICKSDRSLTPPLTVMAVELSGDTGALIQPYIHVQSANQEATHITSCPNNYDRSSQTQFWQRRPCPTPVLSLIGLACLKSHCHFSPLHCFEAQSNFRRLCHSHSLGPSGGVGAICAQHHPVGIQVAPFC